ncbi:sensor histidine kinase [Solimonas flava]|uniref:sensor histidine kinase n=1 Tax=Solimonas flava TaxID=415849 RepID=UPI0004246C54|nr:sensor histidine kinase [Solimonas flava]
MLATLLLNAAPGHALDPQRTLRELYHTAWRNKDGAPGEIFTMAQSADGYLWLGTPTGLFRFDGVRFEALSAVTAAALPSNDIYSLLAAPDGGLWIGLGRHGVALLRGRKLVHYGEDQGFAGGPVYALARSDDGAVWAATAQALLHFDGTTWTRVAGLPAGGVQSVYADRGGRVWIAGKDRILVRARGADRFADTGIGVGTVAQFAEAGDGAIWIAETSNAVRPIWVPDADQPPPTQIRVGSNALTFDRDGALWATTLGDGLRRSPAPATIRGRRVAQFGREVDAYGEKDGLSADFTYSILEDREGNVWIGSSRGLDRFRAGAIVPVPLPSGYHALQLVAGARGSVWIGSASRPLAQVDAHGALHDTGLPYGLNAGYRDADGSLWWSAEPEIVRVDTRGQTRLRLPDAAAGSRLQWLTRDGAGRLWIGTSDAGVFVRDGGAWQAVGAEQGLAAERVPIAYGDPAGRVWLGHGRDRVSVFEAGRGTTYGPADGLAVGDVSVIGGRRRIWVGGTEGVAWWTPRGFRRLRGADEAALRNVAGLVEADDGALWIADANGVARAAAAELERAERDPAYAVPLRRFDHLDGLPGSIQQASIHPAALRADDGRLWFATLGGLAWIDPQRIARDPLAPQVLIGALRSGDRTHVPDDGLRLAAGTRELHIDYTATSLGMPERVRFRYRLDGVDADWQDAGTRRQAFYTNLGPGRYRFRVVAANADGVWSPAGAALSFSIAPAFHQTGAFYALCALLAALALWSLHRLRLRQITGRLGQLHQERLVERERIARELHDTLLQSVQGLILRFHAAVARLPAQDATRAALIDALARADDTLEEGRDKILNLRGNGEAQDLAAALAERAQALALEAAPEASPRFELQTSGTPHALQPLVYEELLRIGSEALRNAFRHAEAAHVELQLDYGRRALRLCVRDDGRGIDAAVLRAGRRDGHWGLVGMRERAIRLKARWTLDSAAGAGTSVEITLAAARAYRRHA